MVIDHIDYLGEYVKQGKLNCWPVVAVSTGIVGALVLGASPASAHYFKAVVKSSDGTPRGYVEVNSSHTGFTVCDGKADGKGVYGRMKLLSGAIVDVSDPDGQGGVRGRANASSSNPIVQVEAVWRGGASSGWYNV